MDNLQPKESLAIIEAVIQQRKQKYEANGLFLIFWGILAMTGILQFMMIHFKHYPEKSELLWAISMPLGFVITFFSKMKEGQKAKKQGKTMDWLEWIWFFAGIGSMIGGFSHIPNKFIIIFVFLPMLMASFTTALQLKNKLWLTTSTISLLLIYSTLFVNYGYFSTLITSVLAVLLLLIPGIKLHTDYKKRNNV